jgi:hypothetical protein
VFHSYNFHVKVDLGFGKQDKSPELIQEMFMNFPLIPTQENSSNMAETASINVTSL